jgi:hypothetical protein
MIKKNKDTNKKLYNNMKVKNKKVILLIILSVIILSLIFVYLNITNYLPFTNETKQPVGNIEPINTQKYFEDHPELKEMPNLNKIKYNAWRTNLTIKQVVDSYKQDLLKEGYDLQYENTIILDGKEYNVLGFIKGLNAVGILISRNTTYMNNYYSEIIYTTGNILDFNEIIDWYQSQLSN